MPIEDYFYNLFNQTTILPQSKSIVPRLNHSGVQSCDNRAPIKCLQFFMHTIEPQSSTNQKKCCLDWSMIVKNTYNPRKKKKILRYIQSDLQSSDNPAPIQCTVHSVLHIYNPAPILLQSIQIVDYFYDIFNHTIAPQSCTKKRKKKRYIGHTILYQFDSGLNYMTILFQ